jgi:serine/threonine protein kinase
MSRSSRRVFHPGDLISSYTIVKLIGQGGYGDIYCVRHSNSPHLYAMKIERFSSDKRSLDAELTFLEELQDSPLFPRLIESGRTDTHQFVIQDLLGPSLSETRRAIPGQRYTLSTVLRLAIFMLDCIRVFHAHGFVHRDIKPGNFLLKCGAKNPLALIDFGLSKRYLDPLTRKPYLPRENCGFRGTLKYASVEAHRGRGQCPHDDIVSWLYSVVELAEGRLPWSQDRDSVVIQRKKVLFSNRALLRNLPPEFMEIAHYVGSKLEVSYDSVMCLLCRALSRMNGGLDCPFDWEGLSAEAIAGICAVECLPRAVDYVEFIAQIEIIENEEEKETCTFCEVM